MYEIVIQIFVVQAIALLKILNYVSSNRLCKPTAFHVIVISSSEHIGSTVLMFVNPGLHFNVNFSIFSIMLMQLLSIMVINTSMQV